MNRKSTLALLLLLLCAVALLVGLTTSTAPQNTAAHPEDNNWPFGATSPTLGKNRLAIVHISGPIFMQPSGEGGLFAQESMAVQARKALEEAREDNSIKGVLLRIDSPGGTVAMSQELYKAVLRLADKKPVVASLGDIAASGGYYTASAADVIVANPGSLTGSIGVIISTPNFKGLGDRLGITNTTIKSGQFKDLLSPFREVQPAERTLLQNLINVSYQQFLSDVFEGRTRLMKDPKAIQARQQAIRSVADGRILVGTEALKKGLVDEIGDIEAAKNLLLTRAQKKWNTSEKMPFEEIDGGVKSILERLGWVGAEDAFSQVVPLSMRHSNQPLWLYE